MISLSEHKSAFIPSLPIFSAICCVLIYIFSCKLSRLIQWLGSVFFPIMLVTLLWVIIRSFMIPTHPMVQEFIPNARQAWLAGFIEGFNTMDLLAAFFFCSIVLISLRQLVAEEKHPTEEEIPLSFQGISKKNKRSLALGFFLAAILLGVTYLGFVLSAARHAGLLVNVSKGHILGRISAIALGPNSILTGVSCFHCLSNYGNCFSRYCCRFSSSCSFL
ncbi:Branched-chain amino acid transport system carrier protein [Chlamydia pneumoniae B21]|nr:Branched-chain amino acid transport system carrier protein [Chlamydia pneumoniae B21]